MAQKNKGLIFGAVVVGVIGLVGWYIWSQRRKDAQAASSVGGITPETQALCEKYKGQYLRGKISGDVYFVLENECAKIHWPCATTASGYNWRVSNVVNESVLEQIPTKECTPLKAKWGSRPTPSGTAKGHCNTYKTQFIRGTDNVVYYIPEKICMKVHHPCVNPAWNKGETWKQSKRVPQAVIDSIPTANCKPL